MQQTKKSVSFRSFASSFVILFGLMILTFILAHTVPAGRFDRQLADGQLRIVPGTYAPLEGGIGFFTWLASPFLALAGDGGATMAAIILFLLIIGGTFYALEQCGMLRYMLDKIAHAYGHKKYTMLRLIAFFFMALGACVGLFEEVVPMVPIAIALAALMGWDALTGLGMSILATGLGFATGVLNPFTVGVAQGLAGLPLFSGLSFRLVSFVLIYSVLILFLCRHAKQTERKTLANGAASSMPDFTRSVPMERALRAFTLCMGASVALILISTFASVLQTILMPAIACIFLFAGILSSILAKRTLKAYGSDFLKGLIGIGPAVLLILMAGSIRFVMVEAGILDTLLYRAVSSMESMPKAFAVLFIYLFVLAMNFFISSGSAKAFLLMPLLVPLVDMAGISRQCAVLLFAYGDGFSNLMYPTNPVLLISLGLAGVGYGTWLKWTIRLQIPILALTMLLALAAVYTGYA